MTKKILVGCPTHQSKQFCISWFMTFLKKATKDKDCDVLFVDNSEEDIHAKTIEGQGFRVERNEKKADSRIESIVSSRQMLIDTCLKGDYSHLLFVDTDLLIPENTIELLTAEEKDIIGGIYLGGREINGKNQLCPVMFKASEKGADYMELIGTNEVMGENVMDVAALGFGCILLSRDVLEKVKLRYNEKNMSGEDIYFCKDAKDQHNISTFAHNGVKCVHLNQVGDKVVPYEFRRDL